MVRAVLLRFILSLLLFFPIFGFAQDGSRMMSIGKNEVNVRAGPSTDHPKLWVYKKNFLPIKVEDSYEGWYRFTDWEGKKGWVYGRLVSPSKSFVVTVPQTLLYFAADSSSQVVARLGRFKNGEVHQCYQGFCRVKVFDKRRNAYFGWVKEEDIWGGCTQEDAPLACTPR